MVGENFEFICLKLLELPKDPSNKFHDFGHFPKKTFNNTEQISHSLSGLTLTLDITQLRSKLVTSNSY